MGMLLRNCQLTVTQMELEYDRIDARMCKNLCLSSSDENVH